MGLCVCILSIYIVRNMYVCEFQTWFNIIRLNEVEIYPKPNKMKISAILRPIYYTYRFLRLLFDDFAVVADIATDVVVAARGCCCN